MFDKMSVKMKVVGGFSIVILFTLIMGITSFFIMNNFNAAANAVHEIINGRHARTHAISVEIGEMDDLLYEALRHLKDAPFDQMESKLNDLANTAAMLKGTTNPEKTRIIKESVAQIQQVYPEFVAEIKRFRQTLAKQIYDEKLDPPITAARDAVDTINEGQIKEAGNIIEGASSNLPKYIILALAILALIVATFIAIVVSNYTVNNLNTALKTASAIAQGDLNVAIDSKSQDEFGQLIRATEKMRTELYTLVGQIKTSVNRAVEDFDSIHSITEEISASAQSTENKAVTVAAASDEMVSTTGEIAKNCQSAAATSSQANATTEKGVNEVQDTIRSIQEQVRKTQVDAELIKALVDQSQKIGTIVQTIEDIASQT
ncbi:MAG: methyl-accepting chemotaxis protein, partial [Succinivibrio sp.]|nr:methyl-accepting chemotaxis protein [Succinivibrio sp.]